MDDITNFLFEVNILKKIPRSGFFFLGAGKESVAEHSFMTTMLAFVLSKKVKKIDSLKLISMCLLHDIAEARTADLNYVQQKYNKTDEKKALKDALKNMPFAVDVEALINEFNEAKTMEAKLAKDADQLAMILELKQIHDVGNKGAKKWIEVVLTRLKTKIAKDMANKIMKTNWDNWWFKNYHE